MWPGSQCPGEGCSGTVAFSVLGLRKDSGADVPVAEELVFLLGKCPRTFKNTPFLPAAVVAEVTFPKRPVQLLAQRLGCRTEPDSSGSPEALSFTFLPQGHLVPTSSLCSRHCPSPGLPSLPPIAGPLQYFRSSACPVPVPLGTPSSDSPQHTQVLWHLLLHSFTQQLFIEHLLCAGSEQRK